MYAIVMMPTPGTVKRLAACLVVFASNAFAPSSSVTGNAAEAALPVDLAFSGHADSDLSYPRNSELKILRRFWLLGFVEASFLRAEKTLGESAEGGEGKALNCLQCQLNKLNVLVVKELPGNRAAAEPLLPGT